MPANITEAVAVLAGRVTDALEQLAREAELLAKIDGLNARLNAISEQALHAAVERTLRGLAQEGQLEGALKSLPGANE